jgi:hypothetical protein
MQLIYWVFLVFSGLTMDFYPHSVLLMIIKVAGMGVKYRTIGRGL